MYLNTIEHKNKEYEVLVKQFGGWLFESHTWVDDGSPNLKCLMCDRVDSKTGFHQSDYPPCLKNPIIRKILMEEGFDQISLSQAISKYFTPVSKLKQRILKRFKR